MAPVSDTQLTTLALLKSTVGVGVTDTTQDSLLNTLLTAGTSLIKRSMNRPIFIQSTITDEVYRGNGNYRLFLNTQPVISIISITDSTGKTHIPYNSISAKLGYRFDKYGLTFFEEYFATGYYYTITYVAGYSLTSEEAFMAEQALLSLCNLWWKRRLHSDESARSLGNQITAKFIQDEAPPETRAIINQLKRVV